MIRLTTIGILGGTLLLSANALAQDPTPAAEPAAEPAAAPVHGQGGPAPITGVRAGGIAIWGSIEVNASSNQFAKPFSISPDIIYGVNDALSVSLVHSTYATTGFLGAGGRFGGRSLCLAGKTDGCPKLYNNVGILAKYALSESLAIDGGLVLPSIDPMFAGIKVGVVGRHQAGPVMLMYSPNLYVGATKRDAGNKESINVPVMGVVPVGPVMAGVQTGIYGQLSKFGDNFGIPLSVLGMMHINPNLMAGASFTFNRIAGKGHSADFRSLTLFVGWNN